MDFSIDTDLAIAGIVLGLVAIAVAIPPFIQMLWGRPKLMFEADEFTGTDAKILVIAIKNQPIKNRFLRGMKVEREIGNVLAFLDIQEQGTKKFLVRAMSGALSCAPTREQGLLARALPGFTVGLTVISTRNGEAVIVDPKLDSEAVLTRIFEGHYVAHVTIVRGDEIHKISQPFKVGKADHETIWYQRNVVSIRE